MLLTELGCAVNGLLEHRLIDVGLNCLLFVRAVVDDRTVEVDVKLFNVAILDVHHLTAIYKSMARFAVLLLFKSSRPMLVDSRHLLTRLKQRDR